MAFEIPALKDVVQRARNAFRTEMPGSDAWIWPNNVYVSAKVIGGSVWELFGRLKWIDKQRFAMTATGDQLLRHGAEYGLSLKPASPARGKLIVKGPYPLTIPSGTVFTSPAGVQFTTTASVDVGELTDEAIVQVVASTTGRAGNNIPGAPFSSSLAGVTSAEADEAGIGLGSDGETLEQFRQRVLDRKRYPPHGGAEWDYVRWAKEIPGVTRAFVAGNAFGPGTVGVWPMMDESYDFGIPQSADIEAIQEHIDAVKPVTATVIVQAPFPLCVDVVVRGLSPDTREVRDSAAAELQALFRSVAQVGLPGKPFTLHQSWLWNAVSNATGERSHKIVTPDDDMVFPSGVVPCLRSVRFVI